MVQFQYYAPVFDEQLNLFLRPPSPFKNPLCVSVPTKSKGRLSFCLPVREKTFSRYIDASNVFEFKSATSYCCHNAFLQQAVKRRR